MRCFRSFWFYAAAMFIAAVVFLLLALRSARSSSVKLADGRVLTIEQVTYGTQHSLVYGSLWSRIAAPLLPAKWKGKSGAQSYMMRTPAPSLMIWGEWELPAQSAKPASWGVLKAAVGEQEVRLPGRTVALPAKGREIMAWNAANFPRRAAKFRFQVCDFTNSAFKVVADFELPNPARRRYPVWRAEPLPVVRQSDGMQIEIANFSQGVFVDEPWLSQLQRPLLRTGYVAIVQVKQDGQMLDNWQVNQATVLDATGNRTVPRIPTSPSMRIGEYMVFGLAREDTPLWPDERAWKMIPQLMRTAGFASNELCLLGAIPVPTATEATQVVAKGSANGLTFTGVELKRRDRALWAQRIRQNIELQPLLSAQRADRHVSLFQVTDDRGRPLPHDLSYFNTSGKHFGVEVFPDSQTLNLTFAVQKPVTIEVTVGLSEPPHEARASGKR